MNSWFHWNEIVIARALKAKYDAGVNSARAGNRTLPIVEAICRVNGGANLSADFSSYSTFADGSQALNHYYNLSKYPVIQAHLIPVWLRRRIGGSSPAAPYSIKRFGTTARPYADRVQNPVLSVRSAK